MFSDFPSRLYINKQNGDISVRNTLALKTSEKIPRKYENCQKLHTRLQHGVIWTLAQKGYTEFFLKLHN